MTARHRADRPEPAPDPQANNQTAGAATGPLADPAVARGAVAPCQTRLRVLIDHDESLSAHPELMPDDAQIERWAIDAFRGSGGWSAGVSTPDAGKLSMDDNAGIPNEAELSLRITDSNTMRELNAEWRDQDKPTNVLSFPSALPVLSHEDGTRYGWLGDVVLCPAVIAAEASQQSKALNDHWAHLVVHGVLHLLGMDHRDAAAATVMESLEIQILSGMDIDNPYVQLS